jgi:hypothetical protein
MDRKAMNDAWAALADRDYRIELTPGQLELVDPGFWREKPDVDLAPEFPNGLRRPLDHEFLERAIVVMRLWREGNAYWRQRRTRHLFEIKPELMR